MKTGMFSSTFVIIYIVLIGILKENTFDIVLTAILVFSSIIGNVTGIKIAKKINSNGIKIGLSLIMLIISLKFIINIIKTPSNIFTVINL